MTDNPVEEGETEDTKEAAVVIETDKGTGKITRYPTKTAIIPKGATENNEMGFYLDGEYTTVINEYKEVIFELSMTLHHNGKK